LRKKSQLSTTFKDLHATGKNKVVNDPYNRQRRQLEDELAKFTRLMLALDQPSIVQRIQAKHQRVQQALQRLQNGSYGFCERCHEQISQERLVLLPYTERCWRCQQAVEALP